VVLPLVPPPINNENFTEDSEIVLEENNVLNLESTCSEI
jgi:hypothetical protein